MRTLSLEYHDVVEAGEFDRSGFPGPGPGSYKLTPALFAEHLEVLSAVTTRSPSRTAEWHPNRTADWPLFLTFDDGGVGAYTHTADALERYGWRGHFFVTSGRVGTPTFLSSSQIRELHGRGHVIGTHSSSHPTRMGACSREDILREWETSIRVLSDIVGEDVVIGSVPGGYYTPRVAQTAAQAGLKVLFTSVPTTGGWWVDGCCVLGRYSVRRWSKASTVRAIAEAEVMPRAWQWFVYRSLRVLRAVGGDRYKRMRDRFWARQS